LSNSAPNFSFVVENKTSAALSAIPAQIAIPSMSGVDCRASGALIMGNGTRFEAHK
jgi:hypothetical protein